MSLRTRFDASPSFLDALEQVRSDPGLGDARFPARNFMLECEVPESRVRRYLERADAPARGAASWSVQQDFNAFHDRYLSDDIRVGVRSQVFHDDAPECPDTFRQECLTREYGGTGAELSLVRLEQLAFVADSAMWDHEHAKTLLASVGAANRLGQQVSNAERSAASSLLDAWQDRVDGRPLFAAFWDDASEIADWERPGWANVLRDRMGLAHYDPALRGDIDVVLFRYPVALVPRGSAGARLLVRPTVLDASLSEAFYTGPPSAGVGSTVDLVVRDESPWQEVLHPAVPLRPSHVWGVDTIDVGLAPSLADARGHHALKVALDAGGDFADLCGAVDGDL